MARPSKVYLISDDDFRQLIQESTSIRSVALKLGMSAAGSNVYYQVKKRCAELNIDLSHFNQNQTAAATAASTKYSLEDIMVANSPYTNTSKFNERLIKANLIPYECACCGNKGEWQGKELILQLDHINGNHQDNRQENLRFLCPNCHSQTETFSRRKS